MAYADERGRREEEETPNPIAPPVEDNQPAPPIVDNRPPDRSMPTVPTNPVNPIPDDAHRGDENNENNQNQDQGNSGGGEENQEQDQGGGEENHEPTYEVSKEEQQALDAAKVWEPHYTFDDDTGEEANQETQTAVQQTVPQPKGGNMVVPAGYDGTIPSRPDIDYDQPKAEEPEPAPIITTSEDTGTEAKTAGQLLSRQEEDEDDWPPFPRYLNEDQYRSDYEAGLVDDSFSPETLEEIYGRFNPNITADRVLPDEYPVDYGERVRQTGIPAISAFYNENLADGLDPETAWARAVESYNFQLGQQWNMTGTSSETGKEILDTIGNILGSGKDAPKASDYPVTPRTYGRYDPQAASGRNNGTPYLGLSTLSTNRAIDAANDEATSKFQQALIDDLIAKNFPGRSPDSLTSMEREIILSQANQMLQDALRNGELTLTPRTTKEEQAIIAEERRRREEETTTAAEDAVAAMLNEGTGEEEPVTPGASSGAATYPVADREVYDDYSGRANNPVNTGQYYTTDELYREAEEAALRAGYRPEDIASDRFIENYVRDARDKAAEQYVQTQTETRLNDAVSQYIDNMSAEDKVKLGLADWDKMTDEQKRIAANNLINPIANYTDQEGNVYFDLDAAKEGLLPDGYNMPGHNEDGSWNPAMQAVVNAVRFYDKNGVEVFRNPNGSFSYADGKAYKDAPASWRSKYTPEDIMSLYVNSFTGDNGDTWRGMEWIDNLPEKEQAGMRELLAKFVGGGDPNRERSEGFKQEFADLTPDEFDKLYGLFLKNMPELNYLLQQGYLDGTDENGNVVKGSGAQNLVNFFFKALKQQPQKPKGNNNNGKGGYRSYGRGGGGGRRGGGGGSRSYSGFTNHTNIQTPSRGGGGISYGGSSGGGYSQGPNIARPTEPNQANQKTNRVYNIMKNWSF